MGIRLITRRGNDDSTTRYRMVVEAVTTLHRQNEPRAFLYAFDVLAERCRPPQGGA
jgi:hypothetical protein